MNIAKIIEAVGFILMAIAFIQHLCHRQGFYTILSEHIEVLGLLGLLIWSLAYGHRRSKSKK